MYTINFLKNKKNKVKVSKNLANKLNLTKYLSTTIVFGLKIVEVDLLICDEIDSDHIFISQNIINRLNMPITCTYNILIKNNRIVLGPLIGVYIGKKKSILKRRLHLFNSYIWEYSKINGVIFVFSLDGINRRLMTVEGFYYNPDNKIWENVILPFPSAIYKRGVMNKHWREYFGTIYGNKIYNEKPFNKWNMYERLTQFKELKKYFPSTIIYTDQKELLKFINKNKDIYVKPKTGLKGLGIYNIQKNKRSFQVKTRKNGKNIEKIYNLDEFLRFVDKNIVPKKHLLQKTLDIKINNRSIDFRLGLDKDQTGEWINTMLVSRESQEGSIVSNRAGGGEIKPILQVLQERYNMSKKVSRIYKQKLIDLSRMVSHQLEKTGLHLGKLAFDIAIDESHKIWIIEINNRYPDDTLANSFDKGDTYKYIRKLNILYAKKLAGFTKNTNNDLFKFKKVEEHNLNLTRYRLYISYQSQEENHFIKKIKMLSNKYCLVGFVKTLKRARKIKIEIEGSKYDLDNFILSLQSIENHYGSLAIGREIIPVLSKEDKFERIKHKGRKKQIKELSYKLQAVEKERDIAIQKYKDIKASHSWIVTAPLRRALSIFKSFFN